MCIKMKYLKVFSDAYFVVVSCYGAVTVAARRFISMQSAGRDRNSVPRENCHINQHLDGLMIISRRAALDRPAGGIIRGAVGAAARDSGCEKNGTTPPVFRVLIFLSPTFNVFSRNLRLVRVSFTTTNCYQTSKRTRPSKFFLLSCFGNVVFYGFQKLSNCEIFET